MYQVKTQQFAGPLEKLLELIEEKKLEITQISLAEVTGGFLNYVKELGEKAAPSILADFLVVASRLVLIKSKVLLPSLELTDEEEGDIKDLETRLKIYREFKNAGQYIQNLWNKHRPAHSRQLFMNLGDTSVFYPPTGLKAGHLTQAIKNLAAILQQLTPETQKIKSAVITIEQKISELLNRFAETAKQSFKIMAHKKSREEIIVFFLAVLHLLKERIIQAEQEDRFGDILIEKSH